MGAAFLALKQTGCYPDAQLGEWSAWGEPYRPGWDRVSPVALEPQVLEFPQRLALQQRLFWQRRLSSRPWALEQLW